MGSSIRSSNEREVDGRRKLRIGVNKTALRTRDESLISESARCDANVA